MIYDKYRMQIKTGDLFFTASSALFSRIIRFFTQSSVSHVGVFLWLGERLFIVEALEGEGVVMSLASERVLKDRCWWGVSELVENTEEDITNELLYFLGSKYDLFGALASLFVNTRSQEAFCSELAAKALGISFSASSRGITPDDLTKTCKKLIKLS